MQHPLIVIHGGPGMSHHYLKKPLQTLLPHRKLIFYDQFLAPDEKVNRLDYRKQLLQIVKQSDSWGVIAHSFGAILLFDLLTHEKCSPPKEALLISPAPKKESTWHECIGRFWNGLDPIEQSKITKIQQEYPEDGLGLLNALIPHYLYDPKNYSQIEMKTYSPQVNTKISSEFAGWDFTGVEEHLPQKSLCVYGKRDLTLSKTKDYDLPHKIIEQSGHFPFIEQPDIFLKLILGVL